MPVEVEDLAKLDPAPDQTLVFLVRHGETEWNRERRFQGHVDVDLSVLGAEQAAELGRWLDRLGIHFTALYTSDLSRAAQTAQAIANCLAMAPIPVPALREIHCGEWQGLLASELEAQFPEQVHHWRTVVDRCAMPGGESLLDVQSRVYTFYREAVARHGGQAIIIVSHGAALSALVAAIKDVDLGDFWRERRLRHDNTGVTVVLQDHYSRTGQVLRTNLTAHLSSNRLERDGIQA